MSLKRSNVAALALSAAALIGIAGWESYKGEAYIPVPGDVPTIGFGSTAGVKMGDKTDPVRALIRLGKEADEYQVAMRKCVKVPVYQYEWDAYTSLAYNIGTGAFCKSTLVRKLNAQDYQGACKEILRWDKAGGRVLRGLTNRREAEYKQCIGET